MDEWIILFQQEHPAFRVQETPYGSFGILPIATIPNFIRRRLLQELLTASHSINGCFFCEAETLLLSFPLPFFPRCPPESFRLEEASSLAREWQQKIYDQQEQASRPPLPFHSPKGPGLRV